MVGSEHKPFAVLEEKYATRQPTISPDGKWLAYYSNEYGKWQVYITSFPKPGGGSLWWATEPLPHGGVTAKNCFSWIRATELSRWKSPRAAKAWNWAGPKCSNSFR